MAITPINVGNAPDDGTGDPLRVAYQKTNANVGELDANKVDKVAGQRLMTDAEATKLAGVAAGATANATDGYLLNRANHTGTQAIGTVAGLQATLDAKAPVASPAFTGTPSVPNLKIENVASADVRTLDHYEEGTFTPTLFGVTAAGTVTYIAGIGGDYTRIGNRVFWSAWVGASAITGMQGVVRMGGLPYIVRNGARYRGAATISQVAYLATTDISQLSAYHFNNTASVAFLKRSGGQTGSTGLDATDLTGATQFYMSGQYEV